MEAHKSTTPNQQEDDVRLPPASSLFADFFTFPQYSTRTQTQTYSTPEPLVEVAESSLATTTAAVGDIEVTMVESHANIKILAKKQPSQLVKLVAQMQSLSLTILHLNVTTTAHHMVLYSVSIKLEEGCHLNTVDEIAAAVNEMLRRIQEEAAFA
ncbi:Transcription factor bHLH96 [Linum grandiflorum]